MKTNYILIEMKYLKPSLIAFIFVLLCSSSFCQNFGEFNNPVFPVHLIDTVIIKQRGLEQKMEMLKNKCNWSNRIGAKIDVFWLKNDKGNFFGHSYEYFLDCDNLRLIYWYQGPYEQGKIVDFMIENLEDESAFVVAKKKHLKNRKQYHKYLSNN